MRRSHNSQAVLSKATKLVGYRAQPNRAQPFGPDGRPWDGAFVDHCLRSSALTTGVDHQNTTAALAAYTRMGQVVKRPKPGDLVFYAFGVSKDSTQPHIGVFESLGSDRQEFLAIEGEVWDGKRPDRIAVARRTRYMYDVIAFVRPHYMPSVASNPATPEPLNPQAVRAVVRPSHFVQGRSHRSVELVQLALGSVVGLQNVQRGRFDAKTQSAYAAWQRQCGYEGTGRPDTDTLQRLAHSTGNGFDIRP